jgi:PAS domain S-box-containing protein
MLSVFVLQHSGRHQRRYTQRTSVRMPQPPPSLGSEPFVLIYDRLPVLIWISGVDGRWTYVNKPWFTFTSRSIQDHLGDGWLESVHRDDRARCADAYRAALEHRQPFESEHRLYAAGGAFRWVLAQGVPWFAAEGTFGGYVGSCLDITYRKTAEVNLSASETWMRLLADNARDMIYRYRVSPSFETEYISPAALALTGRTPEEFAMDPDLALSAIHPDDRRHVLAIRSDPERFTEPIVLRWLHPDGQVVYVEHRNTPVYDSGGRLIAVEGIGRDVTESLSIQNRLRKSERQLRRQAVSVDSAREAERTHVARELHDELGQDLTALKLEVTRLVRTVQQSGPDPSTIDSAQALVGGIEVATETVRRLASSLRPPALDHLGLVAAIELEAAGLSRRTGVRCRIVGNRQIGALKPAMTTAVFRIVQEALTNVARHANASAISIRIHGSSRFTSVKIQDNGRGIPEDQISDPTAIGLLGMRERADLVGAALTITSKPGKGTAVTVHIPATRAAKPRKHR